MKIYEAKTLLLTMEARSKEYQQTKQEFAALKEAFLGVTNLGDDFQGKGADNIKAFYKDQAGIVDNWLDLIDSQIQFLDGISNVIEEAELSNSFIDIEFLDNQLANAYTNSKSVVSEQKKELVNILADIKDLLPLEPISDQEFKEKLDVANKERESTIQAVNDLDTMLINEYATSETTQQMVMADYTALLDAIGIGESASQVSYDSKAYRSSETYQLKNEVHKNAESYIKLKIDQAEAQKIAKEQAEPAGQ
ncbi:T7SS effector LXG polymorphic toxin [Bacillus sp. CLL-7-23]|uniref:T7SS effector LXG polymorphic toxin n=1 Tax=Bacillus changyiensis TaxID=3004103 RepID=A0ABT4WZY1_9BACI|nr:T7SS effector LXG polymorphic toxin [Bacillus changyiensis]MDA7025595.1 T7SS effector LXG polymorphic toxin [Bacillus changyiensis]